MRILSLLTIVASGLMLMTSTVQAQNTSQLSENNWFSDDTRADGTGSQAAGTDLVSPFLTADPEGTASGNVAHNADINSQIVFGEAPGTVPAGTHRGAMHLVIAAGAGSGKCQVSDRKDDGIGYADGATAFGAAMSATYSWMGDGTVSATASLKFGVKTAEFGSAGISTRTGENSWDKILIYEPGNLNGGTSDGMWQTETVDFTTGKWWFFDRVAGASSIGSPMTLSDMSTSLIVYSGTKTLADVYALIADSAAYITGIQFGVGSGNPGASVYVNQLTTSFYRTGSTTTFGSPALTYDENVTNNVIFGSGNLNGAFTVDRNAGVEIGLRGKVRFPVPMNVFNSNGDGTYTFNAGTTGTPKPLWSFEWSVNTDWDGSTGSTVGDFTYEIGMDFDPTAGTNYLVFDQITPGSNIPYTPAVTSTFWDHAFGTNATAANSGASAADQPTYDAFLASENLVQNSWRMDFFDNIPFDIFDPEVTGRYEFYVAAFDGANEVSRSNITIIVERPLEYDQNVTNNTIMGSGIGNGSFTTDRNQGVEVGMRAKVRFPVPLGVYNSNGDGTYVFDSGVFNGLNNPQWGFEWSVNSDFDGSSGIDLDALTYEIGMDFDSGTGTTFLAFDHITPPSTVPYIPAAVVPFWDHSIGDNGTAQSAGMEAVDIATYTALLANNNLAQNSWRLTFFDTFPFDIFDASLPGRYDFYLSASNGANELARTEITVLALNGASLTLEADDCQSDQDLSKAGVQIEVEMWMRNLGQNVTGYQSFLSFDDSQLTYEGADSSYSAAPFATHFQDVTLAEVSPGELRFDGNGGIVLPVETDDDSLLATLVFTVASECDPSAVIFDLGQGFPSELSYQGAPVTTSLLDGPAVNADATPPILTVPADITVAADAGVGTGCTSAVVNFTPTAVDSCGAVSIVCTPPSGSAFLAGQTTTVTCVATDDCGNTDTESFDVTVTLTNLISVDVQLVGAPNATTRCIQFITDDCGSFIDVDLAFDATGFFSGKIEVPCGAWTSLCAKDEQHTFWGTQGLVLNGAGTEYVANATIDLIGGDTDNDGDVDINDVTLLLLQFGSTSSAGGCPWTGVRDADFSNNGAVGAEDYAFLAASWLTSSSCACTVPVVGHGPHVKPVDRLRFLRTTRANRRADWNVDGRIDWKDVRLLEASLGLPHELSRLMQNEDRGSRDR